MGNAFTMNKGATYKGPMDQRKLDKYVLMEQLRTRLISDRSPYLALWTDIQSILDPHMVINDMYQAGFPQFVTDLFLTSRHQQAFDDLLSGLQEGIMPASQTWMRYGLLDEESPLMDDPEIWEYLHVASRQAQATLLKSNFYQQSPNVIRSVSRYLTGAIMMERDEETFVRFTSFPIGSYMISNNNRGIVDTFCYPSRWHVRQVIEEFCTNEKGEVNLDNCSTALQLQWRDPKRHEEWVDVVLMIFPNPEYDSFRARYDSKYAKYSLNYYELSQNIGHKILREEGFSYFPVYCPRWYRQPTDAYGVDGPGNKARSPIRRMFKSIQMWLLSAQKLLEPPMGADPSIGGGVSNNGVGTTPNFLTMIPGGPDGNKKFAPIYELNPAMLTPIKEYIEECVQEIDKLCMADVFRRFGNDERNTPPTATEVLQRVQEDSRILGPIFGAFNYDWLQPMLHDIYYLMVENRIIPPAPKALHGQPLKVEVISRIAIALKQGDINALNAGIGAAQQIATVKQTPGTEALNADEALDYTFRLLNLPPKLLYTGSQLAKIRQQITQMRAQKEQAAMAEQHSKTAKNLGQASVGGDSNLLEKIMESQGGLSAT